MRLGHRLRPRREDVIDAFPSCLPWGDPTCRTKAQRKADSTLWVALNWQRRVDDWLACHADADETYRLTAENKQWVRRVVEAFARRLLAMPKFNLLQQAYNVLDTTEAALLSRSGVPGATFETTKALVEKLMDDTERQVHKAQAWAGSAVGSTAAFGVSEPCTQTTLSTFHDVGDKHENTKDLVRNLLLLTERKHAVFTVFVQPVAAFAGDQAKVWELAKQLLPVRVGDVITGKYDTVNVTQGDSGPHGPDGRGGCDWRSPAMMRRLQSEPNPTRCAWRLTLDVAKLRRWQITLAMIVDAVERKLPPNTRVWSPTCLRALRPQDTTVYLFVQVPGVVADTCDGSIDPDKLFHPVLLRGFPTVHTAKVVPCASRRGLFEVRARAEKLEPFFESTVFDPRTLRCSCPLKTALTFGIEAGQTSLAAEFKQALQRKVHSHHTAMVAAFLCHTGRILKLDRFDMDKTSDDVIQNAAFESTKSVLVKAASHGQRTDNIHRSVITSTVMGVTPVCGTGIVETVVAHDMHPQVLRKKAKREVAAAGFAKKVSVVNGLVLKAMDEEDEALWGTATPPALTRRRGRGGDGGGGPGRRRRHVRQSVCVVVSACLWDMGSDVQSQLDAFEEFAVQFASRSSSGRPQKRTVAEMVAAKPVVASLDFVDDEFKRPRCESLPVGAGR